MNLTLASDKEFIQQLTGIVLNNLEDENFGVEELIRLSGLGKNTLRHRLKTLTRKTISQFISEVRLNKAREWLEQGSMTVSEVSWKTGFGSPEYFTRCYHDFYGYPPGDEKKKTSGREEESVPVQQKPVHGNAVFSWIAESKVKKSAIVVSGIVMLGIIGFLIINEFYDDSASHFFRKHEKSIAILPFINDSPDSTNAYFINGVMDMILDNLSKINDLRVISRTSVEQYRYNRTKTIPEIARELGVNYIVEGSGQKSGDQIMLTIQLIDAKNDKHLYSEPYTRKLEEIFDLQKEIALAVADQVNAVITPEETRILGTPATGNIQALNALMRGDEYHRLANLGNKWELDKEAAKYYLAAIRLDSNYAHAYVQLSWVCSTESALMLLDKALKINNKNFLALTAKGHRLSQKGLNEEAKTNLKKAIALNPKYTSPYRYMGNIMEAEGDFVQAVEYKLKGYRIDDRTNPILTHNNILGLCAVLKNMGLNGEGLIFARKLIEFKNDSSWYHLFRINMIRDSLGTAAGQRMFRKYYLANALNLDMVYLFLIAVEYGETDIAIELFKNYCENHGTPKVGWPQVGYILKIMGSEKEAASEFEIYIGRWLKIIQDGVRPSIICQAYFNLSYAYSGLGDRKKAMEYLRLFAGCKNTSLLGGNYFDMKYHPLFDLIREEPEFKNLLAESASARLQAQEEVRKVLRKEGFKN
jgi:TolB-like protein/AraC-like DNA-binding protein